MSLLRIRTALMSGAYSYQDPIIQTKSESKMNRCPIRNVKELIFGHLPDMSTDMSFCVNPALDCCTLN